MIFRSAFCAAGVKKSASSKIYILKFSSEGVKNTVLKDARIQDVAAIACYALGINGNEGVWESKIPTDLFEIV